jgi:hypothetical protein
MISDPEFVISNYILSLVSFFSSVVLCVIFAKQSNRSISLKIIIWIAIWDGILAIGNLLFYTIPCAVTEFVGLLCFWCSLFCSTALAIFSYRTLKYNMTFDSKKFYRQFLTVTVIISFIITAFPLTNNGYLTYGIDDDNYCTLIPDYGLDESQNFIDFLIIMYQSFPLLAAFVITAVSYALTI